jgi:predicted DNA-binding protein with PD1-like motif
MHAAFRQFSSTANYICSVQLDEHRRTAQTLAEFGEAAKLAASACSLGMVTGLSAAFGNQSSQTAVPLLSVS